MRRDRLNSRGGVCFAIGWPCCCGGGGRDPLDAFPTLVMAIVEEDNCDSFCDELCPLPLVLVLVPPPGADGLPPPLWRLSTSVVVLLLATAGMTLLVLLPVTVTTSGSP